MMTSDSFGAQRPTGIDDAAIPTPDAPLVSVHSVNHFYGTGASRSQVLFDVELTLLPGELVAVTGPSGAGKSTLLTLIGGLRSIQQGSIRIFGRELHGLSGGQLTAVRRQIGFIFQSPHLLQSLTAQQNVQLALNLHKEAKHRRRSRSIEMLGRVGLGDRLHHKPRQLSGGERQRVGIARALVHHPKLILADEPTAALDHRSAEAIIALLRQSASTGAAILVVTHDADMVDASDRTVHMVNGAVRAG
jgi:putative ABC transport system ATP-binding protein